MFNKIRFLSICLLTTLFFSGCGQDSLPEEGQEETGEWPTGQNVFVAGFENIQDEKPVARLWKNGKMEKLTNGNNSSRAYTVYVSGDDVYAAGVEDNKARLWKNGIVQNIADDKDAIVFFSVFVSNGDVYTSGYVTVEGKTEGNLLIPGYLKATLWRNGKKLNLTTEGKNNSQAMSIFVK
ncbi:hypothetical protein [Proteiniphilum sp. UBA5384]|mgnify:CR=1 FL=1|uniref:hypothetical protein n=1 Tax=Proteiniphilum sp. UBA5384 TaxID=1947279 RepID=UPI0025FAC167|nr:hypothetical protein [Proteiniphilum sp. UBA5384]